MKKINANIIPVINKVDHPETYILPSSYYSLKQDFLFVSAEHNLELDTVLDTIETKFSHYTKPMSEPTEAPTRISIMGKPNVGKSSIINKILKDELVIVSPIPGTTRDSVDLEIKRKNKTFILVDNAGIRKLQKVKEGTESAAVIRAEKDIRFADIIILVLDIAKKIDQNDLLIAHKILKSAKPVIIACNKWDLVKDKNRAEKLLTAVRRRLNFFYFAPFVLVSAVTGKNLFDLIDRAENIQQKLNQKIKTSYLNTVVQDLLSERKFLTEANRVFNPKYMFIGSYRPFFINFHTSSGHKLKSAHETYIKKRLVVKLDLEGIPVFFKITAKKK